MPGRFVRSAVPAALLYGACFLLCFLNPFQGSGLSADIRSIFTFVGTLFAILAGFFISSLWDRFTRLRTLVAYEAASLENIYKFCELVDPALSNEAKGLIDRYIVNALDRELSHYQEQVRADYFAFYDLHKRLAGSGSDVPYTRLLNIFDQFAKTRKEILSRVKDRLGLHQWGAMVLLSFLIVVFWLHMQFGGWFGIIMGSIFMYAIAAILFIIYDLNNPRWCGEQGILKVYDVNIEVYERVFDVMQISRYYPEEFLASLSLPAGIGTYRVGLFSDTKNGERKIVEST
ncbi:MAG TPA: DUF4239 domain-containing protein [bacterium]|nr:DUF4239 domain-containing protein [bacterium]